MVAGGENISGQEEKSASMAKRIAELEAQIADLKRRMPAHTPRASMIQELEELEEELERLQGLLAAPDLLAPGMRKP